MNQFIDQIDTLQSVLTSTKPKSIQTNPSIRTNPFPFELTTMSKSQSRFQNPIMSKIMQRYKRTSTPILKSQKNIQEIQNTKQPVQRNKQISFKALENNWNQYNNKNNINKNENKENIRNTIQGKSLHNCGYGNFNLNKLFGQNQNQNQNIKQRTLKSTCEDNQIQLKHYQKSSLIKQLERIVSQQHLEQFQTEPQLFKSGQENKEQQLQEVCIDLETLDNM